MFRANLKHDLAPALEVDLEPSVLPSFHLLLPPVVLAIGWILHLPLLILFGKIASGEFLQQADPGYLRVELQPLV